MTPEQFNTLVGKLDTLAGDVRTVKRFVDGGSSPERGLNTRVLMLERESAKSEETARNAKGVAWGAATTAVGAMALWVWNKITKGHGS